MNYTSNKQHQDSTLLQVLQHDINKALTNPPSIEDIRYAISKASLNTSGGQTGCTYNMMKCWSDAQLSNLHAAYALIWNSDTYPDFWNDRWMHPIPKVLAPIIELKDLRPIMLLEVTRKLFTQILIKRVTSIWEKNSALAPQQHGSRRNVMTASPIFQLLNVLEQAQESACSVFGSSYDIVHAYDSISHNIQRLGWYRLGIPEHFANLLVHMEANCRTYVKSPFAQHTLSEEGPSGFDNTPFQGFFRASRGTGQGDVPSSHCFISVFDILYRAISIYEQTFYFVQFHGHLHPAYDTGYVDDLVCIGDTLDSLQRKADIMSAFCIVFGLDIAVKKLRTFFLQWDSEAPSLPSCQIHLHHTDSDTVVPVDLSPTGTFKYLGSYIDSNGSSDTNFDIVHNRASSALSIISPKLGPNNEKIKCTLMSLYPQALYILGFCNDNLQRYNKIDTIFRKFFRQQTKHLPSFPTILIHLPHKYGGLNIPSLADRTHICKWNHVQRGQRSGSAWQIATSGLLDRYLRLSNYPRLYPFKATISATTDLPHLWSNSLIQWLHSHDLTITHGGAELPPILEPLLPLAQEFQLPSHIFHALGLYHIQDISVYSQGVRTWIPSLSHTVPGLTAIFNLPCPQAPTLLQIGQCYYSTSAHTIYEFLGYFQSEKVSIRKWQPPSSSRSSRIIPHMRFSLCTHTLSSGAATNCLIHTTEFLQQITHYAILGPDSCTKTSVDRELLAIHPTDPPYLKPDLFIPTAPHYRAISDFCSDIPTPTDIYTDGSSKDLTDPFLSAFGFQTSIITTGALIFGPTLSDTNSPIRVIQISDDLPTPASNNLMELIMVTLALFLRANVFNEQPHIHTDSQVSINAIFRSLVKSEDVQYSFLLQTAALYQPSPNHLHHVRAHTGNNDNHSLGNHIADRAAANDITYLDQFPNHKILHLHITDLLSLFSTQVGWFISYPNGQPLLSSIQQHIHNLNWNKYTSNRQHLYDSIYRWSDLSIQFATKHWNFRSQSYCQNSRSQRILFDKHLHGRNMTKHDKDHHPCPLCNVPTDSQNHILFHCEHPDLLDSRYTLQRDLYSALSDVSTDPYLSLLLNTIHSQCLTGDDAHQFLGLWTKDQVHQLKAQCPLPATISKKQLSSAINKYFSIATKHASQIWAIRTKTKTTSPSHRLSQPSRSLSQSTQVSSLLSPPSPPSTPISTICRSESITSYFSSSSQQSSTLKRRRPPHFAHYPPSKLTRSQPSLHTHFPPQLPTPGIELNPTILHTLLTPVTHNLITTPHSPIALPAHLLSPHQLHPPRSPSHLRARQRRHGHRTKDTKTTSRQSPASSLNPQQRHPHVHVANHSHITSDIIIPALYQESID